MDDNATLTAINSTTTSCIISEDEYRQYTADWKSIANPLEGPSPAEAFYTPDGVLLLALSFPLQVIQWLVSPVGVRYIKARFLLTSASDKPQFSIALFATDETGYRLSSYYVPGPYSTAKNSDSALEMPIPSDLATLWMGQWKTVGASRPDGNITKEMFTTYTTDHKSVALEGYNFKVKDFVSLLFETGDTVDLSLGLHQYHAPEASSDADLSYKFGLVLQMPAALAARGAGAAQPDFDMAAPSPPNN